MTIRFALGLAMLLLNAPRLGAQSASARVEQYVQRMVSAGQFSGSVLVARGQDIIFERAYEADNRGIKIRSPSSRLYPVASVTKVMTGIIARTLVERGQLRVDDPVAKWIPDFPNGDRILVSHLLAHRSGIPHRVTSPTDERRRQSAASMATKIGTAPLAFEPGMQRLYSSAGFSVLARVLEAASGKSYARLLREVVLQPSDAIHALDATDPAINGKALPRGHFWTADGPIESPAKDLSFLVGAGSMWATPRDLFRIARRVADGAFGTAASGARNADGSLYWTGFSDGYMAIISYIPATDVTVVVQSNLLTGAADLIVRDAPTLARGDSVPMPDLPRVIATTLSAARRAELEGDYLFGGTQQAIRFTTPRAALMGGEYLLIPIGPDVLYAPQNYLRYHITTDSGGAVTAFTPEGGGPFAITRVRH